MSTTTDTTYYRDFKDPQELIAELAKGYVLYQVPLDSRPYTVKVRRYTIRFDQPTKSTLTFWTSETGVLTVNIADHFDRFKKRA